MRVKKFFKTTTVPSRKMLHLADWSFCLVSTHFWYWQSLLNRPVCFELCHSWLIFCYHVCHQRHFKIELECFFHYPWSNGQKRDMYPISDSGQACFGDGVHFGAENYPFFVMTLWDRNHNYVYKNVQLLSVTEDLLFIQNFFLLQNFVSIFIYYQYIT